MATTYTDQQAAIDSITNANINTNGTGAITGAVHNLNEIEQNLTMFTNLVAYDNYNYKVVRTNGIPNDNGQELRIRTRLLIPPRELSDNQVQS